MPHAPLTWGVWGHAHKENCEKNEAAKTCSKNFHCWKVFKASTKVKRGELHLEG